MSLREPKTKKRPKLKRGATTAVTHPRETREELEEKNKKATVCFNNYMKSKDDTIKLSLIKEAVTLWKEIAKKHAPAQCALGYCYEIGAGCRCSPTEAFHWYYKAAKNKYADAYYYVAMCYLNGRGVTINETKGIEFMEKATKENNVNIRKAKLYLGRCYKYGLHNVPKKNVEVFKLIKAAADGNPILADAQYELGLLYEEGVIQDTKSAFNCFQKAAEKDHAGGLCKLGDYFMDGSDRTNFAEAFNNYQKAANLNNPEAQYKLGVCYEKGNGVYKDLTKALELYEKAAANGNDDAKNNMGWFYMNGIGGKQDREKAFQYFKSLESTGDDYVQFNLGLCYDNGWGTNKDSKKATELFELSSNQGNVYGQYALRCHYEVNSPTSPEIKRLTESIDNQDRDDLFSLGLYLKNGWGFKEDIPKAFYYFNIAAKQGNHDAQINLGFCYENGEGVSANLEEAEKYYKLAADEGNPDAQFNLARCYNERGLAEDAEILLAKSAERGNSQAKEFFKKYNKLELIRSKEAKEWWEEHAMPVIKEQKGKEVDMASTNETDSITTENFQIAVCKSFPPEQHVMVKKILASDVIPHMDIDNDHSVSLIEYSRFCGASNIISIIHDKIAGSPVPANPVTENDDYLFVPIHQEGLIITMGGYDNTSPKGTLKPLVTAKNDGMKVEAFLKSCTFQTPCNTTIIHDAIHPNDIEKAFKSMCDKAKSLSQNKQKGLFFIYYSGHGVTRDSMTVGFTIAEHPISLEANVRKLAAYPNVFVIALLDCCREVDTNTDYNTRGKTLVPEKTPGNMFIIHAVAPTKSAVSLNDASGVSEVTGEFLQQMYKVQTPFPSCISRWCKQHKTVEVVDKCLFEVVLKSSGIPQAHPTTPTPQPSTQRSIIAQSVPSRHTRAYSEVASPVHHRTISYGEMPLELPSVLSPRTFRITVKLPNTKLKYSKQVTASTTAREFIKLLVDEGELDRAKYESGKWILLCEDAVVSPGDTLVDDISQAPLPNLTVADRDVFSG